MAREPSRSAEQDNDKILKKIQRNHPEFELTYDMMLGIRQSVSTSEMSIISASHEGQDRFDSSDDESQLESDFSSNFRYRFPASGSTTTPAHMMRDFKFKDYCPQIFKQLREWFGISQAEYLVSLCGDFEFLEFISNSKSGQFFFFSHNQQYMIKTMTRAESLLLRKILPAYFRYVSRQPNTLLTKFFGMHRVKPHKRNPIYFLIMSNVFYSDVEIHIQYDLKGSTFGRRTSPQERERGCILKDLDWMDDGQTIVIGQKRARLFHEQLRRDTEFLRKLQIMDYSLLIGIHYRDRVATSQATTPLSEIHENSDSRSTDTREDLDRDHGPFSAPFFPDGKDEDGKEMDPTAARPHSMRSSNSAPLFETDLASPRTSGKRSMPNRNSVLNRSGLLQRRKSGLKPSYVVERPADVGLFVPSLITPSARVEVDKTGSDQTTSTWARADINEHENPFTGEHGGMCFEDENGNKGNEIYFTGVIDILQKYNKRKKVENFFKSLSHDPMTISAVAPEVYARRLCDFMKDKVV